MTQKQFEEIIIFSFYLVLILKCNRLIFSQYSFNKFLIPTIENLSYKIDTDVKPVGSFPRKCMSVKVNGRMVVSLNLVEDKFRQLFMLFN